MSTSAAQKLARQRYKEKNIELVAFEVKKGMSAEYSAAAAELGLGKMEMIRRAIAEFIANHGGDALPRLPTPMESAPALPRLPARIEPNGTQPAEQISATQRRLLDVVDQLPADAQKSLLKFLQSLSVAAENKAENTAKNASVDAQEPI